MIGFCPYEFFKNSKVDLGSCKDNHMDAMREAFLAAPPAEREPYERKYQQVTIGALSVMPDFRLFGSSFSAVGTPPIARVGISFSISEDISKHTRLTLLHS